MDTVTTANPYQRQADSAPRVHADDESVEIFVPESESRYVVIATLDGHGRPATIARWDPESRRFDAATPMR
jgi:hypothetical protein